MIADEILDGLDDPATVAALRGQLTRATMVRIQNVADYFFTGTGQEYWDLRYDFPNCAPPWPTAWFEWRTPQLSRSDDYGEVRLDPGANAVVVDVGHRCPSTGAFVLGLGFFTTMSGRPLYLGTAVRAIEATGEMVIRPDHPMVTFVHDLLRKNDVDFDAGDTRLGGVPSLPFVPSNRLTGIERHLAGKCAQTMEHVVFLATSFAHCKNVARVTEHVGPALQKKRARLCRLPIKKYITLDIGPMQRIVHTARTEHNVGFKAALHIVRGHFKTYTATAPLMGRHVGTYFWAQHKRGDAEAGEVIKTYDIHPGGKP